VQVSREAVGDPGRYGRAEDPQPSEGRLIGEIKRRTDAVGIFPNDAAIIRLFGALLLEQTEACTVGRYMSLETLAPFGHSDHLRLPAVAV
jgi:putative transposase